MSKLIRSRGSSVCPSLAACSRISTACARTRRASRTPEEPRMNNQVQLITYVDRLGGGGLAELTALLTKVDGEQSKSLWPSLLEGAVPIDRPLDTSEVEGEEYIYWAN